MATAAGVVLSCAVEGSVDEHVLRRVVSGCGGQLGLVYGLNGKASLLQKLRGYNNAARHHPWIVLVDLDQDADCAPPFVRTQLPQPAQHLCFRVAVRAVEAWLLADRDRVARFLSVPISRLPMNPDLLDDPKASLIDLARRSRKSALREDMVPRPGSGRREGSAYASRLIEFAADQKAGWRPSVAARTSDSLARAIRCISRLVQASK